MTTHRRTAGASRGKSLPTVGRREFVLGSLAVGAASLTRTEAWAQVGPLHCVPPLPPGQPVAFVPPTTAPVRVRKSVFELDATEVDRLRAAYAALRNLYRDDPRAWYQQGAVHCWYCSGAMDGLNGQEIHGGWWFLPWHRAYLYFHEQILGHLVGDPSFTLPYWDWESAGRNRFPDIYANPGNASNPLFDATRGVGPTDRIPDFFVGTTVMQSVANAASFADFGGSSDQGRVDAQGADAQMGVLEGAPHGGVHVWVTDPVNFSGAPDMGSLGTAAFDPVFFAHHANIDRLWSDWLASNPAHANPSINRWLAEQPFYFYDQAQTWTFMLISQMVDSEASLRYRYQPPSTAVAVAGAAVAAPSSPPRLAQIAPLSAPILDLSPAGAATALTPAPTTLQVAVPQAVKDRMMALTTAASTSRLVLRIDGVEIPADRGVVVKVYVNRPDATAATGADEAGFVGTIVVVPATAPGEEHLHKSVVRNFAFDITREAAASLQAENSLSVTLVPTTGTGTQPSEVNLHYLRVYVASR